MRDPERVFQPKRDELADLPLAVQRSASPEVARPVATAVLRGAGQTARAEARERASHTTEDAYRTIALSLEGHGPQTRKELATTTGMNVNTINARISEMRDMCLYRWRHTPEHEQYAVYTEGRRGGESIVHLARLAAAPTTEG